MTLFWGRQPMNGMRWGVLLGALVFAFSSTAAAAPAAPAKPAKPARVKVYAQGEVFCPASVLVVGNVVIAAGRCYVVHVLRDNRGAFLAFAAPDAKIPPGQLVRLNTPAGAKVRGRIFFLVPIRTAAVTVPVNVITPVAFRVENLGPALIFTITSTPAPNLAITFQVRL